MPAQRWLPSYRRIGPTPSGAGNVLATLVRHPDLTAAYLPFNAYLLRNSTLSPRIREVALLRVVRRGNCDYLWSHHVPIAARAGLSPEDISGIRSGNCPDRHDQLVIQAVDDLIADSTITQRPGMNWARSSPTTNAWIWSSRSAATSCWLWLSTRSVSRMNTGQRSALAITGRPIARRSQRVRAK